MELRLLYFPSCPGWEQTKENMQKAVNEMGADVEITEINIENEENLPATFYGSPSISYRMNKTGDWRDLFGLSGDPYMACRPYRYNDETTPHAPVEMIKEQLQKVWEE